MDSTSAQHHQGPGSLPSDYALVSRYAQNNHVPVADESEIAEESNQEAPSDGYVGIPISSPAHRRPSRGSTSTMNNSVIDSLSMKNALASETTPLLTPMPPMPRIEEPIDRDPSLDTETHLEMFREEFPILTRYALPVFGTHLLEYTLVVASVVSIGHLSTNALAAISLGSMTASVSGFSIIQGFTSALDTLLPSAWTSTQPQLVGLWAQRMCVVMAACLIPTFVIWFNAEAILLALRQDPEVAYLAALYLRWVSLGLPAYAFNCISRRYFQSQNLFSIPTRIIMIVTPINAFLNYLLVEHSRGATTRRIRITLLLTPLRVPYMVTLLIIVTRQNYKDMDALSHHRSYSHGIPHTLQQQSASGAGTAYQQGSSAYLRRGSGDFTGSDTEHSLSSSAASSNVHLPLDPLSYNDYAGTTTEGHQQHHSGFSGDETSSAPPNSAVSSAFGSLSLDDPDLFSGLTNLESGGDSQPSFFPPQGMSLSTGNMNLPLTGLSGIPADDPDATPMPLKETSTGGATNAPPRSASTSNIANIPPPSGMTPREGDLRELREFWKQYMRTPLSGPGPADGSSMLVSPPRRPRVASMPSAGKTPTVASTLQHQNAQRGGGEGGRGESGMRTTLNEDLRSYEAAVLARKAPTLNLVPKIRRGTVPALHPPPQQNGRQHQHSSASPVDNAFQYHLPPPGSVISGKGVGVVPLVNFELLSGGSRPSSSSTNRSGSSGEGSGSSLAGAFGTNANTHHQQSSYHNQHQHQQHGASPHHHQVSFTVHRRGSPSASSAGRSSSSRASSVLSDRGDIDSADESSSDPSSLSQHHPDDARRRRNVDGGSGRMRPSFKRLASTTLGPSTSKRQVLDVDDVSTQDVAGGIESDGHGDGW
ncbi:hypothetical protein NP233_g6916 [Leucocoprinus birnbaumii]|uniref:Uncharacterized protein n=1 Tax=Leucocoprinus birnbaumii TaxID=56174 RepID=A0AAD5VSK6_9AGAR|nr:hypothetical protein NP233_g6916 [Leucocoprinus birnbaumii]